MTAGKAAESQQRRDDRDSGVLGQRQKLIVSAGSVDAVAADDQGPFGFVDQPGRSLHAVPRCLADLRDGQRRHLREFGLGQLQLHVAGNVHQHRSGPSFLGDTERFADGRRQVGCRHDHVGLFGAGGGDGTDVAFLERLRSQRRAGHLAGDGHHGHRIGLGPHDAGDQVRRSRPGGGDANADLAADPGIAVGGVGGGLLVAHQNVTQLRVAPQSVVKGKNGPSGMAEQHLYPLPGSGFHR